MGTHKARLHHLQAFSPTKAVNVQFHSTVTLKTQQRTYHHDQIIFSSIDEIGKFMVCFSIDIMEKQPISRKSTRLCMPDNSPVELLHMKHNKSMF